MTASHGAYGRRLLTAIAFFAFALATWPVLISAVPTGASVQFVSQTTANASTPGNRTDAGGTINTILLSATQQDSNWKGYVGNISGKLTLDDATGKTIYDWTLTGVTLSGKVFATRNASVSFTGVSCVTTPTVAAEDAFDNLTTTASDSINSTFSRTVHKQFFVGNQSITNSTCRAIATYVNDTNQSVSESSLFQEVLLQDPGANLIYTTIIEPHRVGYNSQDYDFQMIVGESSVKAIPTTFYFFAEISS